jgi:hypothetical protein
VPVRSRAAKAAASIGATATGATAAGATASGAGATGAGATGAGATGAGGAATGGAATGGACRSGSVRVWAQTGRATSRGIAAPTSSTWRAAVKRLATVGASVKENGRVIAAYCARPNLSVPLGPPRPAPPSHAAFGSA